MLVLAAALGAAGLRAQQAPAFRAAVDMVALPITVTGPDGQFVRGLSAGEFRVLEDGVPQDVIFFDRASSPLTVSLLIDSSNSMTDELMHAQQAAIDFVSRLGQQDSAEIIDFDSGVRVLQPFTTDHALLERAIRLTFVGGSTSMHEAVFLALGRLEGDRLRSGNAPRRQVVLVMTDGADNSPRVRFDALITMVKQSPAVIYTIGLGLNDLPNSRIFGRWAADSEANLKRLAFETGGRLMVADQGVDLSGVYNEIADELRNQYLLGYAANDPERVGWRSITVQTPRTDLTVRTRSGYYYAPPAVP